MVKWRISWKLGGHSNLKLAAALVMGAAANEVGSGGLGTMAVVDHVFYSKFS